MGCLKSCMLGNDENEIKKVSVIKFRELKLEDLKNKNLKETKLIYTMNSSIFKNANYEKTKYKGKIITLK